MIITYHNLSFCKVQFGDVVIAVNPISKDSKHSGARFGADIALISLSHPDFNGVEQVRYGDRTPFTISGPGDYEVKDIQIRGFCTPTTYEKEQRINTIYSVRLEHMNLCFLGHIKTKELPPEASGELDEIDILFLPIGGGETLSASEAYKLSVSLEPKVIIPVHYDGPSSPALKAFLKEAGSESVKPTDKLTLKKKDLEGKEGDIIILASD